MKLFNDHHTFSGMQKDMDIQKHSASMMYNARNVRLTAREGDTLFSITNEIGTKETNVIINGEYLGHCLINCFLVIFSTHVEKDAMGRVTSHTDYITRVKLEDDVSYGGLPTIILFTGNLNFSLEHPIEAIASYENESVQKVYWTDGFNQPRVINIATEEEIISEDLYTKYDFVRELSLNETVNVLKVFGANGLFPAGVIQYALTYYTKFGQETSIFYTSPLIYISHKDRGASPEDTVDNAFRITVDNIDKNFDYLRIYSIERTSINDSPICRRVQDIYINNLESDSVSFIDTGREGDSIDPTELLYKGGEEVRIETLEQKDNTLFFGGITLVRDSLQNFFESEYSIGFKKIDVLKGSIRMESRTINVDLNYKSNYIYGNQLSAYETIEENNVEVPVRSVPCGGFKHDEIYRLGIQFQYKTGVWSDPIYIDDVPVFNHPGYLGNNKNKIVLPTMEVSIPEDIAVELMDLGYVKARGLVVFPTIKDRKILAQGVICPVIYKQKETGSNVYNIQSSWFFRPRLAVGSGLVDTTNGFVTPSDTYIPYTPAPEDFQEIDKTNLRTVEIQGLYKDENQFKITNDIVTFHSPDIEFDDAYLLMDYNEVAYVKAGEASIKCTLSDIDIQTSSPTASNLGGGFYHKSLALKSSRGIVSGLFYDDYLLDDYNLNGTIAYRVMSDQHGGAKFLIYPWHKKGSLNNDSSRSAEGGSSTAVLKNKIISNLRYTETEYNFSGTGYLPQKDGAFVMQVFHSTEMNILKLGSGKLGNTTGDFLYRGNIDTLLMPDYSDGVYFALGNDHSTTTDESVATDIFQTTVDTNFTDPIQWKTASTKDNDINYTADNVNNIGIWRFTTQWLKLNSLSDKIGDKDNSLVRKKDGVRMRYKSSAHAILNINGCTDDLAPVAPVIDPESGEGNNMSIIEIYNSASAANRFGGETPDALQANTWVPCGDPVRLDDYTLDHTQQHNYVKVKYSYGDTYYQRWDCLKTYAYDSEDINQVVEIGSFMLETHINIDGRYDRNRGQVSNLYVSPQNFNMLNPVYSQTDNFFSYKIMDESYYYNLKFPNQITWSKEKHAGADTDVWTNMTLASTLDMDGLRGSITSLNTWNDKLLCFQSKSVSVVAFNSRVQIPVSDGVPIEISNNYKVDGYKYLLDGIGSSNKFSIKETPSGIYFIDSVSNHLYHIGDSTSDITATHNMSSWFQTNNHINKLLYDDVHHDLYIVTKDDVLCYSEMLGQFTSFMDYKGIQLIESNLRNVFALSDDKKLYNMFAGEYNKLFGVYRPWEITFISNGSGDSLHDFDKIFTNLDYRMDVSEDVSEDPSTVDWKYSPNLSFDSIRVVNEYQDTDEVELKRLLIPSNVKSYNNNRANLQKKFRIWRIQIPRNKNSLDRIRNPWCKITLKNNGTGNHRAVLHDLNVQYYM